MLAYNTAVVPTRSTKTLYYLLEGKVRHMCDFDIRGKQNKTVFLFVFLVTIDMRVIDAFRKRGTSFANRSSAAVNDADLAIVRTRPNNPSIATQLRRYEITGINEMIGSRKKKSDA